MVPSSSAHQPSIIVIDDFLDDPQRVRETALNSRLSERRLASGDRRAFWMAAAEPELWLPIVPVLAKLTLDDLSETTAAAYFVAELSESNADGVDHAWIHFDQYRWVALVWLTNGDSYAGATRFYRRRASREIFSYNLEQAMATGSRRRQEVEAESLSSDAWELIDSIGVRANRLLLFNGHRFHEPAPASGESFREALLYLQLTFR
jgi:hypothetical protein